MSKIYLTHCSWIKDDDLKDTGVKVTPDNLYVAGFIQRLIKRCRLVKAEWAIFSDEFGVVFPDMKIPWYNTPPGNVSEEKYQLLLKNFVADLSRYDVVWFYYNPGRFHPLYHRLVQDARKKGLPIKLFSHVNEVR